MAGPNGGLAGKFAISGRCTEIVFVSCWEGPVKPGSGQHQVWKEAAGNAALHQGIHYVDYDLSMSCKLANFDWILLAVVNSTPLTARYNPSLLQTYMFLSFPKKRQEYFFYEHKE